MKAKPKLWFRVYCLIARIKDAFGYPTPKETMERVAQRGIDLKIMAHR